MTHDQDEISKANALQRQLDEERRLRERERIRNELLKEQLAGGPHPPAHSGLPPSNASTVLVLGILGVVFCQILGPIAWVMGNDTLSKMDSGLMEGHDRGSAFAGKVCGIVSTVILGLSLLVVIVMVAAAASL